MNNNIDELVNTLAKAVEFRNIIRDKEILPKERFNNFIDEAKGVYGSAIYSSIDNGLEGFTQCYRLQTFYACSLLGLTYSVMRNDDIKESSRISEEVSRQIIQSGLEQRNFDWYK